MATKSSAEDRYSTLLDVSSAIATQPKVEAIVHSLRRLLSSVVVCDSVSLLLLDSYKQSVRLIAFDRGPGSPSIEIGTEVALGQTSVARAINEHRPIFIADAQSELAQVPELASHISIGSVHSAYVFPISTSRKTLGALVFAKASPGEFPSDVVELMASVSSHIAVAFESAVAIDAAESYQRQLAEERDRFRLLLDINNFVVSKLDTNELFRSASTSIRKYFGNDFTGFWLLDKDSRQMDCAVLDFPGGRGFLDDIPVHDLTDEDLERLRARQPELWSLSDIEKLPRMFRDPLKAESITAIAIAPLATANGPLGVITMGSRRPNSFGQADVDLLAQISIQISLALDNALAYGRLTASKNHLEEERLYLESEIRSEYNFEDIVGKSPALRRVLDQIAIVAPTDSTVLLHGETGTGKELIARAIHSLSPRKGRTFVRLNCALLPGTHRRSVGIVAPRSAEDRQQSNIHRRYCYGACPTGAP